MQRLKHCLNPKVIVGVAAVAAGVWVFAPGAFAAALPLLILAVCPLSMVGMMYMMRGTGQGESPGAGASLTPRGAASGSAAASGEVEDSPAVEALRARVAELEGCLGGEAHGDSAQSVDAAPPTPGPRQVD